MSEPWFIDERCLPLGASPLSGEYACLLAHVAIGVSADERGARDADLTIAAMGAEHFHFEMRSHRKPAHSAFIYSFCQSGDEAVA